MSPEKSKNQFAILFQQYQTQQAEDPQDLAKSQKKNILHKKKRQND